MANVITLSNANMSLSLLEETAHTARPDGSISVPNVEKVFARPWARGYDRPAARRAGNRELSIPLRLAGTSQDNIVTNRQQMESIIELAERFHFDGDSRGAPAQLLVQLNGATYPTVFDVLSGGLNTGSIFQYQMQASAPSVLDALLSLTCKPYTRSQSLTRHTSSTLNNGGGSGASGGALTITRPAVGEVLAPARVKYTSAAGDTWSRLDLAHWVVGDVSVMSGLWPVQCEVSASTTELVITDVDTSGANLNGSSAAGTGTNSGGAVWLQTSGSGAGFNSDLLKFEFKGAKLATMRGKKFHVWLRLGTSSAGWSGVTFYCKWGGSAGTLVTNRSVTYTPTGMAMLDLGEVTVPDTGALGIISSFIVIIGGVATFDTSGRTLQMDCFFPVPESAELAKAEFSSATTALDTMIWDYLDWVIRSYLISSAGNFSQLTKSSTVWLDPRFTMDPFNDHLWLPLAMRKTGSQYELDLTDQGTLVVEYYPLYDWLR